MMLLRGEFIGKKADVEGTTITGTIIDETKHTFVIETTMGNKKLAKNGNTFIIHAPEGIVRVSGKDIASRPEERIKNW